MVKKNHTCLIISVILFLAVIVFAGLYFIKSVPDCPKVNAELCSGFISACPKLDEKAIINAGIYDWGYNELDTNQLLFDYWIYNYGKVEAKNIKVRCKLFDVNNKVVSSSLHNYGNLASQSVQLGEFTPQKPSAININGEYSPICYVESCENCDILYKNVPDLIESYESD